MAERATPAQTSSPRGRIPVGYNISISLDDCLRPNRSAFPFQSRDAIDRIVAERLKTLAEMHLTRQTALRNRSRPDSQKPPIE